MKVQNRKVVIEGRLLKTVRLEEEWYEDIGNPSTFLEALSNEGCKADIFTFWQRVPDSTPQFDYVHESEDLAVLPVGSFEEWWEKGIKSRTRGLIRKCEKSGVVVRETEFTDDFIRGMVRIFNETPIRQGRKFWHYGKDFDTVKREFSRFLFRETLIGAYINDELIGFVMLADAGQFTMLGQIISMVEHRDKATNNALIAKTVEITARKRIPYLVYNYWNETGLTEFKRRNGFEKQSVPRYYVPLSLKGRVAIAAHAHRPLSTLLPTPLTVSLKRMRSAFYAWRWRGSSESA